MTKFPIVRSNLFYSSMVTPDATALRPKRQTSKQKHRNTLDLVSELFSPSAQAIMTKQQIIESTLVQNS